MSSGGGRLRLLRKQSSCARRSRSWLGVWPGVEEQLSRLVIAREVVDEVLDGAAAEVSPVSPVSPASGQPEVTASPGLVIRLRSGCRRRRRR